MGKCDIVWLKILVMAIECVNVSESGQDCNLVNTYKLVWHNSSNHKKILKYLFDAKLIERGRGSSLRTLYKIILFFNLSIIQLQVINSFLYKFGYMDKVEF